MSNAPFPPITDVEGGPSSGGGGGTWQATVQRQDDLMRQQDRGLDELSRQVRGLHNMGTAIGDEIRLQDGLLDQLGNDVDRTRGNMQSTTARAKRLLKKSRDNWKMCTIVLLIIGGVVGYYYYMKHKKTLVIGNNTYIKHLPRFAAGGFLSLIHI